MGAVLAWVITGAFIGWTLKAMLPGPRRGVPTGILLGVVGALVGGGVTYLSGKTPGIGASVMGAVIGAALFSIILVFYEARQGT